MTHLRQTKIVLNTVTSTKVKDITRFQTVTYLATATATTTEVQRVKETGLSECLGRVGPFFCRFFIGIIKLSTLSVNRSGR